MKVVSVVTLTTVVTVVTIETVETVATEVIVMTVVSKKFVSYFRASETFSLKTFSEIPKHYMFLKA